MPDLFNIVMGPDDRALRLSIKWRSIDTDDQIAHDLCSYFSIGMFIGDEPLFSDPTYKSEIPVIRRHL